MKLFILMILSTSIFANTLQKECLRTTKFAMLFKARDYIEAQRGKSSICLDDKLVQNISDSLNYKKKACQEMNGSRDYSKVSLFLDIDKSPRSLIELNHLVTRRIKDGIQVIQDSKNSCLVSKSQSFLEDNFVKVFRFDLHPRKICLLMEKTLKHLKTYKQRLKKVCQKK